MKRVNQKKTIVDGYEFASMAEAGIYLDFKNDPKIELVKVHPKFTVFPGFTKKNIHGKLKKHQAITYTADFLIIEDRNMIVVEVKSKATLRANSKSYPMRRKLFLNTHSSFYFREIIIGRKKREVKEY